MAKTADFQDHEVEHHEGGKLYIIIIIIKFVKYSVIQYNEIIISFLSANLITELKNYVVTTLDRY